MTAYLRERIVRLNRAHWSWACHAGCTNGLVDLAGHRQNRHSHSVRTSSMPNCRRRLFAFNGKAFTTAQHGSAKGRYLADGVHRVFRLAFLNEADDGV